MSVSDVSLQDLRALGFSSQSYDNSNHTLVHTRSSSNDITNNVYGINHRQTPLAVPMNRESYGLTFFTRPQLNLQSANLRSVRRFAKLLNQNEKSYQRMIRVMLDPRLSYGMSGSSDPEASTPLACSLVDMYQPFIPILTNSLNSISGWPSLKIEYNTTKPGIYKEEHSMVDSVAVDYSAYDVTANFRNSAGSPIVSMFDYWIHYQSLAYMGDLSPYLDFITENELDYNTRIYRLTLDTTKTTVQSMACCGAAFPVGNPIGEKFDYNNEKPYNDANAEIAIPFHCNGFIYDDDIIIRWFNETVGVFHPEMRGANPNSSMTKVPLAYLSMFNCRGYPRINPDNYELEWYVPADVYLKKLGAYASLDAALDGALGMT